MGVYIREDTSVVQTFDFQNDGQSGWSNITGFNSNEAIGGFETGEGYYLRRKKANVGEAGFITMPGTLPAGTLTKIKIRYYLPSSKTGAGINDGSSVSSGYNWGNGSATLGFGNATPANIGAYTGELTTEYNLTSTTCTGECAGVSFSFSTSQANNFISAYSNGTLKLYIVSWSEENNTYIRKVELTIEP